MEDGIRIMSILAQHIFKGQCIILTDDLQIYVDHILKCIQVNISIKKQENL